MSRKRVPCQRLQVAAWVHGALSSAGLSPQYGFVNSALEKLIQRRFGEEMWQEICAKAAVLNGTGEEERGTFMTHFIYEDQITGALVSAAVEILGACVCVCGCVYLCMYIYACMCVHMHRHKCGCFDDRLDKSRTVYI